MTRFWSHADALVCLLQSWLKLAQTKTARHKLSKFLARHAHLIPADKQETVAAGVLLGEREKAGASSGNGRVQTAAKADDSVQSAWLMVEGVEGASLLAEVAHIITKHGHAIKVCNSCSGSVCLWWLAQHL